MPLTVVTPDARTDPSRPLPRRFSGWTGRRIALTLGAGALGAGFGYAASWALALATCTNGGCPPATEPGPFIALLAVVAAWAAASGARS
jgi:hypothetical protein